MRVIAQDLQPEVTFVDMVIIKLIKQKIFKISLYWFGHLCFSCYRRSDWTSKLTCR